MTYLISIIEILVMTIVALVTYTYILFEHIKAELPGSYMGGAVALVFLFFAWALATLIFVVSIKSRQSIETSTMLYCVSSMTILAAVIPTTGLLMSTILLKEILLVTVLSSMIVSTSAGMIEGVVYGLYIKNP